MWGAAGSCGLTQRAGIWEGIGEGASHLREEMEPTWVLEPGSWEPLLTAPSARCQLSKVGPGPGSMCDLHQVGTSTRPRETQILISPMAPILLTKARTPPLHMNDYLPQRRGTESLLRGAQGGANFSPAVGPPLGFGDVTASPKSAVWLIGDQSAAEPQALSNTLAPPARPASMWGCSRQPRKGCL